MIRRPPRSTPLYSSAASDVYKRQTPLAAGGSRAPTRTPSTPPPPPWLDAHHAISWRPRCSCDVVPSSVCPSTEDHHPPSCWPAYDLTHLDNHITTLVKLFTHACYCWRPRCSCDVAPSSACPSTEDRHPPGCWPAYDLTHLDNIQVTTLVKLCTHACLSLIHI